MSSQLQPIDAQLLAENRHRMLTELRSLIRMYQARYELSSDRVEAELAAGRLRETAEICDWIIALHTVRSLQQA